MHDCGVAQWEALVRDFDNAVRCLDNACRGQEIGADVTYSFNSYHTLIARVAMGIVELTNGRINLYDAQNMTAGASPQLLTSLRSLWLDDDGDNNNT
jgi:hypothetical protein